MSEKINLKIFLKTFIFFPFFMVCVFSPLMISIVLTSFLPNGKYFATKLYEFFGWVGLKFVGINLKVEGAEKIDDNKSYVVVSNHPSTLDIFTHITALPVSIRFLTKSELFRIPIFGRVLKVLGLPRIDRENASANFDKINYSIERVLENKNSIMVFPEGKRSNQKDLLPFKKGAAYISKNFNLPIIPVVSHNAHNLMVKGKVWLKSGDVQIEILDPIYNVNDYTVEELTSKLESIIKEKLLV
jgi:1-acyl-sn-glycerol-3-phosphate acyltransferase